MYIKTIMISSKKLICLSVDNTIKEAIEILDQSGLLSLPVVDGKLFVGLLSKGYVYETYFKSDEAERQVIFDRKVGEFIKTKIPTVDENVLIEDAAVIFLNSNLRFIPVTKSNGDFAGIVTHKNLFKDYQKIFGSKLPKIVIIANDFRGVLAKISSIVAKEGGNIKNVVQKDAEVMGAQEIICRIDCKDIKKIVNSLNSNGIQVRYFSEE